ncbi:Hypothetical predicted protein, partial [Mytilus galloprovincialis]
LSSRPFKKYRLRGAAYYADNEINMHRYGRETDNSRTDDISSGVWKESREVGVGRARTNDGKVVVVTNYRPAGNRPGVYSQQCSSTLGHIKI